MIRDLILAARARRAGARHALGIIRASRRAGIPASWGFALVEQESGFANIFGCDQGSILCHLPVDRERVRRLISHVDHGGISNGVGLTQLTSIGLIKEAERAGGAHKPGVQLRVGFAFFAGLVDHGRNLNNAWRYNGSPAYQASIAAKAAKWHKILTKGAK